MHTHSVLLVRGTVDKILDKENEKYGSLLIGGLGRCEYEDDLISLQNISEGHDYVFKVINVKGAFSKPESLDRYILSYMDNSIISNPDEPITNGISIGYFNMTSLGSHACSPDTKLVVDPVTRRTVVKSFKCGTMNYIEMNTFSDKDNPIPSPYTSYYECDDKELKRINDKIGTTSSDRIDINTKWRHDDLPSIVDLRQCNGLGVVIIHRRCSEY